ncbi:MULTISPECIES: thioesterase family protein [unclassified Pseudonocardia]|uniref:acyl-CoA thioesterase n=1 Tax=unclassified Pseudonocardia TaxID=2619320 RepID=UPI00094B5104|nr:MULTISPECIES: acyl-CoA thioesterase [unclassified Pseudonocardia]
MSAVQPGRFTVRIGVRSYEMDVNGHVNHAVYHQYAEHARMEHLRAAGLSQPALDAAGITVVLLSTTVHFRAELRVGEQVEIDSEIGFTERKPFTMRHRLVRETGDGRELAAEAECTMGVLDVATRRLVADPYGRLVAAASAPEVLGPGPARQAATGA